MVRPFELLNFYMNGAFRPVEHSLVHLIRHWLATFTGAKILLRTRGSNDLLFSGRVLHIGFAIVIQDRRIKILYIVNFVSLCTFLKVSLCNKTFLKSIQSHLPICPFFVHSGGKHHKSQYLNLIH